MNIFGLSLEEIQAEAKPLEENIDILPGIPAVLSPENAAHILAVSPQTIGRMIDGGDLITDPNGNIPRVALTDYIETHALADIPVLEDEIQPIKP
jgi:hypothetical protein